MALRSQGFSTFTNSSRFCIISSAPFTTVNSPTSSSGQSVCVDVSCRKCGSEITPVRLHVWLFIFQNNYNTNKQQNPKKIKKVKSKSYGELEVFTSDEVVERLQGIERGKEQEELEKRTRKEEQKKQKQEREEEERRKKEEREQRRRNRREKRDKNRRKEREKEQRKQKNHNQ